MLLNKCHTNYIVNEEITDRYLKPELMTSITEVSVGIKKLIRFCFRGQISLLVSLSGVINLNNLARIEIYFW